MESLKVRPVFKRQQDNFDKILKVSESEAKCACETFQAFASRLDESRSGKGRKKQKEKLMCGMFD